MHALTRSLAKSITAAATTVTTTAMKTTTTILYAQYCTKLKRLECERSTFCIYNDFIIHSARMGLPGDQVFFFCFKSLLRKNISQKEGKMSEKKSHITTYAEVSEWKQRGGGMT